MPWRECCRMDERLRFVARSLEGEKMAVLCREFDISRKTGYKIFARYKDCGIEGLTDRSRRTSPAVICCAATPCQGQRRCTRSPCLSELRPHLYGQAQNQLEPCFCRPGGRHQGGRREDLARDLHALRFRLLRSRDRARRMRAQSIPGTGVTYVSGMIRYPCHRNGPERIGRGDPICRVPGGALDARLK